MTTSDELSEEIDPKTCPETRLPRPETSLGPSVLNEYASFQGCHRYFAFRTQEIGGTETHSQSDYKEAFQPLNPLLQRVGDKFEEFIESKLAPYLSEPLIDCEDSDTTESKSRLVNVLDEAISLVPEENEPEAPKLLSQVSFKGEIGTWNVAGDADLILVWASEEGAIVRIIDIKSSQEEKSSHQIQTAAYSILLEQLISSTPQIPADEIVIQTGVVTRETAIDGAKPEDLPRFDRQVREDDVRRLCRPGGELHRIYFTALPDVEYTIDSRCSGCAYNEGCHSDSIEQQSIRLLGITPSEQETLAQHGIKRLEDLAGLLRAPSERDATDFSGPSPKDRTLWGKLTAEPGLGEKLPELVERAQIMLGDLGGSGLEVDTSTDAREITGAGYTDLPEDGAPDSYLDYPQGSLVRVYLNVQHDHLRDRLNVLAARVTATKSDAEDQRIATMTNTVPDGMDAAADAERDLLTSFIEDLRRSIEVVTDGLSIDNPPIHFYTYTENEHNSLVDGFERHSSVSQVERLAMLFDHRQYLDQPMATPVLPELRQSHALRTPTPGVVHVLYQTFGGEYNKSPRDWTFTPEPLSEEDWADGKTDIDVRSIFSRRLFDRKVPYEGTGDGIDLKPAQTTHATQYEDEYPSRPRYGADIPLGYIWAAVGRIDGDWAADLMENQQSTGSFVEYLSNEFRYHDPNEKQRNIRPRDVKALAKHLTDGLEHVERFIDNKSFQLDKKPLEDSPADMLDPTGGSQSGSPVSPSLIDGCKEYIILEHHAGSNENESHYRLPPKQRVSIGSSIPIQVLEAEVDPADEDLLHVTARLTYEYLFADEIYEKIEDRCRKKDASGTTSGDWMVMTPYKFDMPVQPRDEPREIKKSPPATIEELDFETGEIKLTMRQFKMPPGFMTMHDEWTTDSGAGDEDTVHIGQGEHFILDPRTGGYITWRSMQALDNAEANHLYRTLEDVRWGRNLSPQTTTLPSTNALDAVVDWISENYDVETLPSREQKEFITEWERQFQLLQGPPGTGKTGGAEGPAIATRALAGAVDEKGMTGLVVGPSNKSIDEVLETTADVVNEYRSAHEEDIDIELVRLTGEAPPKSTQPPEVTYLNYNKETTKLQNLSKRLRAQRDHLTNPTAHSTMDVDSSGQITLEQYDRNDSGDDDLAPPQQTVVFATPTRAWNLINKISDNEVSEHSKWELWDFLAVDEASMLTLPRFLMAGTHLKPDAQILVAGDHRQMPPVQQHEWEDERRSTLQKTGAYLSVLDYLRYLSGDDDVLTDEMKDTIHAPVDRSETQLPMAQLTDGRRCADGITELLQEHVYRRDGIEFESQCEYGEIDIDSTAPPGVKEALDSDSSVTLIVYGDDQFQQVNKAEVEIIQAVLSAIPNSLSTGVVTPHNAQRGAVESVVRIGESAEGESPVAGTGDSPTVDTVERYQGDERDVMILSGTVSDPDFVQAEDKFLLSLNRANVAMSRAKQKLIVAVSESVIGHIPDDPETYEQAALWKGLSRATGHSLIDCSPSWQGTLGNFCRRELPSEIETISMSVYSGLAEQRSRSGNTTPSN